MTTLAPLMSSESPEWYTPAHILERVITVLGAIDLGPCSNVGTPNVPAARHYAEGDDGLPRPWSGRVVMNPPYGRGIEVWMAKLHASYADAAGGVTAAIALVPARVDTQWYRILRDYPVCQVAGRLKFSGHANSAPFPSAVSYLGPDLIAFLDAFGDVGDIYGRIEHRVPMWTPRGGA